MSHASITLQGTILEVGGGAIVVEVSVPGGRPAQMRIPAQRGQEQWAGERLYQGAIVQVSISANSACDAPATKEPG